MMRLRAILLGRVTVLFVFLLVVSAMLWRSLSSTATEEIEVQTRPERMVTYVAAPESGPMFSLSETQGKLRILSYLHLKDKLTRSEYTPQKTFEYGLQLRLVEKGKVLVTQDIWHQTRKSKIGGEGERWEFESVYYPVGAEDVGEPCDPRMVELDLQSWMGPNRFVEIRSAAAKGELPPEVNIVAFAEFGRDSERVDWLLQTAGSERLREGASDLGLEEWSLPTREELLKMFVNGWRRQSTVNQPRVRALYATDYRANEYTQGTEGIEISPVRGVVYNIEGPATLRFGALHPDGGAKNLKVQLLGSDLREEVVTWTEKVVRVGGFRDVSELALANGDDPRFAPLTIPEFQAATIRITAVEGEFRLVTLVDRLQAVQGEPRINTASDGSLMLRPDAKSFSTWMLDSAATADYLLAEDGVSMGDVLMVTLRGPSNQRAPTVRYRFKGVEQEGEFVSEGAPSLFEFAINPMVEDTTIGVTEPTTIRLPIPPGATHLSLESNEQALVSVAVLSLGEDDELTRVARAPYDVSPPGLKWRYAPSESSPWLTINPENAIELETQKRRWRVRSQVRWQPDFGSEAAIRSQEILSTTNFDEVYPTPPETQKRGIVSTIAPGPSTPTRTIESLADTQPTSVDAVAKLSADWNASYGSVIKPDTAFACRLPSGEPLRISLTGNQAVGQGYSVKWNDQMIRRRLLRTTRDTLTVAPPTTRGRLELGWGSNRPVRIRTNCIPTAVSDAQVMRIRRVYSVSAGRPLTLNVRSADVTWILNAIAYSPGAAKVKVTVDGGNPARREGRVNQVTAASRELAWEVGPDLVWLQDDVTARLRGPNEQVVPIGSDWKPGNHRVRFELVEGQGPVWMRFFRLD